ncbi:hypothetical protein OG417_35565 [Actinoallomurus sp. NBC_01490]|uniref:DUF6585 family protein n=1 Tax=Actinoallomurus sp. NBC_01490 TaxID=2903557 RepID=UPI002E2F8878|nr:DUF6585 family protein [Actinoallomurus sp. NBC_01490]
MARESAIHQAAAEAGLGRKIETFALQGWRNRSMRKITVAHVFENGCVFSHHKKEIVHAVRWDAITRFRRRRNILTGPMKTPYNFEFSTSDGSKFHMVGVGSPPDRPCGLERFADVVEPLITAAQLPRFRDALDRGRRVEFGWLAVEPAGIRRGRTLLSWPELDEVRLNEEKISVRQHGRRFRWAGASVPDVPNLGAFLALTRSPAEDWRR